MTDYRWGFLGAGNIARIALAPAVRAASGNVLTAVGARDAERAATFEPAGRSHGDYAALCDDPDVDGIYISLTNDRHLPWIEYALAAGKDVLCEKPLCLTAGEARRAYAAAEAAGRLLVEASWYRWHPRTRRAEELIADGALGETRSVAAAFCGGGPEPGNFRYDPSRGGGALYDVGCYAVSAVHWALGDLEVAEASARMSESGVDLDTDARLVGPGREAVVTCSIDAANREDLSITGSSGSLVFAGKAFTAHHDGATLRRLDVGGRGTVQEFAPVDAYQLMVEAFAVRARGGDAYVVTPAESVRVAQTLDDIRARTAAG